MTTLSTVLVQIHHILTTPARDLSNRKDIIILVRSFLLVLLKVGGGGLGHFGTKSPRETA